MQPRLGTKGVGVHQVMQMIGWKHPLGPLRRELYQLVRVPEDTLFKFKVKRSHDIVMAFRSCDLNSRLVLIAAFPGMACEVFVDEQTRLDSSFIPSV